MRDETAKDNSQTAALISHDLTRNNELAKLFFYEKSLILSFSNVGIFFLDFGFGRIDMNDIGKAMLNKKDRISRSDTARRRV